MQLNAACRSLLHQPLTEQPIRRNAAAEEIRSPFRPVGYEPTPRAYREVSAGHFVRID